MTKLQLQQIKLNEIVAKDFGKVAVILEGRDTAGKTGTIRELTHYLPTSKYSVSFSNIFPFASNVNSCILDILVTLTSHSRLQQLNIFFCLFTNSYPIQHFCPCPLSLPKVCF